MVEDSIGDRKTWQKQGREQAHRSKLRLFLYIYAIGITIYHLLEVTVFLIPSYVHISIHWGTLFSLGFLMYYAEKREAHKNGWPEMIMALLPLAVPLYIGLQFETLLQTRGLISTWDNLISLLLIVLSLEATRRAAGWPLVIVGLVAISYSFFGQYLPYVGHAGYSFSKSINQLGMSEEGVLGLPVLISATFVILFVAFGAFLEKAGGGEFFIKFAYLLTGNKVGGPAKTAVVASSLMGNISGSAAANVMVTGTFTIPLMKRAGYPPEFAGAVEAVASTGGPIMPPVMAGVAFLMAEYIGVPYVKVMIAAIIPAYLYYFCCYLTVHFRSVKMGVHLQRIPREELPDSRQILRASPLFFIPITVLVVFLVLGYSAMLSAFLGGMAAIASSYVVWSHRMSVKTILDALALTSRNCINIVAPCAAAGLVAGAINLTGIGVKFGSLVISLAGEHMFLALLLTALMVLILGCAIPPIACYVIGAVMCGPPLVKLGLPVMHVHMFIFYFAIVALITPPVALSAYFAAGIAKASVIKTSILSSRIGLLGFVVPFMFIYFPPLLLGSHTFGNILPTAEAVFTATLACFALVWGFEQFIRMKTTILETTFLFLSAGLLLIPEFYTDAVGVLLLGLVYGFHARKANQLKRLERVPSL